LRRLPALILLCSLLAGCELLVDFDRDKIPSDRPARDAAVPPDAAAPDAGRVDAGDEDAGREGDEDAG
jgi:hypothetical protein